MVAFIPPAGPPVVVPTDVDGRAVAAMPDGATVAIARTDFGERELTVFLDVPAGAALIDGPPLPRAPGGPDLGERQATVAPYVGVARLAISCGGSTAGFGGQAFSWHLFGCARAADATLVATGADAVGQRQYAARRHVDLRSAEVVALPDWRPMTASQVVLTSIPEAVQAAQATVVQDDGDLEWNRDFVAAPVEGASLVLTAAVVPERIAGQVDVTARSADGAVRWIGRRAPLGLRTVVDLGSEAPPWISPATLDAAARTVTWAYQGGGGRRPAVVLATFGLSGVDNRALRVIAPGAATTARLPTLPVELAAWDVDAGTLGFEGGTLGVDIVGQPAYVAVAVAVDQAARAGERQGDGLLPRDGDHAWWITGR
ncbi:MAG: hypothetical protein JNK64_32170 [Myxococcales bacterium]|nr:hypothetical protein [Myxococcales bacterium]